MTKKLYTSLTLCLLAIIFMSNAGGRGATAGVALTGAPGETGDTCGSGPCHNAGNFDPIINFELVDAAGVAVDAYRPGMGYTARITIGSTGTPGGYGFQMVALNSTEAGSGAWGMLPSNIQQLTLLEREYVEQSARLDSEVIEVPWEAPLADEGDVTFYVVGNAVNGGGTFADDGVGTGSFSFKFDDASSIEDEEFDAIKVFPNPTVDYLQFENVNDGPFEIYSPAGKLIQYGNINNDRIDVQALNSGMYFLKINELNRLKRFIKI